MGDQIDWKLIFSGLAVVVSILAFLYSRRKMELEKKEIERKRIIDEMLMYLDIAYGDKHNWFPDGPSTGVTIWYDEYSKFEDRFYSYSGLVDEKIRKKYLWVTKKTIEGMRGEQEKVKEEYKEIRKFAENKVEELRNKLEIN